MSAQLPLLAVVVPLLLALAAPQLKRPLRLLPWAALPALAAALLAPRDRAVELTAWLPGAAFQTDATSALFLGCGALVWLVAGLQARVTMGSDARAGPFAAGWLMTLAGAAGAVLAVDAVTFYAAFSVMSLAAWVTVIHERTDEARYAGRVYIALAVFGEAVLLASLALAAAEADGLGLAAVREAVGASAARDWIVTGLIVGLGIKAGLVPLHAWLALAHPVAPVPASAVLSGVLVKVGLYGLLRLLPLGDGHHGAGALLVALGLVSVFYAAAVGLMQSRPKRVLAYSTVSHAGLAAVALGAGAGLADTAAAREAAAFYATQEGLYKGALFLAVGVTATVNVRWRRTVLVATTVLALGAVGLPFTGGAVMKQLLKELLAGTPLYWVLAPAAAAGALLMLRFVHLLRQVPAREGPARHDAPALLPWALLGLCALGTPWLLWTPASPEALAALFTPAIVWAGLWPIAAAAVIGVAWMRLRPGRPARPTGRTGERWAGFPVRRLVGQTVVRLSVRRAAANVRRRVIADTIAAAERPLRSWQVAGPCLLLLAMAVLASLAVGR